MAIGQPRATRGRRFVGADHRPRVAATGENLTTCGEGGSHDVDPTLPLTRAGSGITAHLAGLTLDGILTRIDPKLPDRAPATDSPRWSPSVSRVRRSGRLHSLPTDPAGSGVQKKEGPRTEEGGATPRPNQAKMSGLHLTISQRPGGSQTLLAAIGRMARFAPFERIDGHFAFATAAGVADLTLVLEEAARHNGIAIGRRRWLV